ncbi:MAG: type II toxin-antitoxin system VapC family toxin [Phyllobacteriaceae bacterium]|jgi:ribonuclease VapC|nr:type II toxin-antitoxin system VapC family toxin [Phyllobacteriaceae bacterium]
MVVDSSVIVAIVQREDGRERLAAMLEEAVDKIMSRASYLEYACVLYGRGGTIGLEFLESLVADAKIELVDFDHVQLAAAIEARTRFGRSTDHPARLNFGDCFSYALAKTRDLPLLFKGEDFVHTDIVPALEIR